MPSLLIQNAKIATSSEIFDGDVLCEDGKISVIASHIPSTDDMHVLNASGKYLLPGGIDAHTHLDLDVGFTRASDDFYTGTVAAAYGGTTSIVDHMAFGPKGCRLTHQSEVYRRLSKPSVIDYGFHGVIQHVDADVLQDMQLLRDKEGISSFKIYLTYDDMLPDGDVFKVLECARKLGLVICAHCENDGMVNTLRKRFVQQGKTTPYYHPLSRPAECEEEAVFRFLTIAEAAGEAKVYVVHLTTHLGLEAIRYKRAAGQKNILVETCPQYLTLDDHLYTHENEALKYLMSPPLRTSKDISALWEGLSDASIDVVATDHCPFFFKTQKQRGADDFTQAPNGAPGIELRMPIMFSEGFIKGRISLPHLVNICSTQPAKIFGFADQKGDIVPGLDADFVLFDPDINWTVRKEALHENVDYTPYEGMQLTGFPTTTISRGEIIVENGRFIGEKGRGRYISRKAAL